MNKPQLICLFLLSVFSYVSVAGEADVIDVDIRPLSLGKYTIATTLRHADTGWDHYANAWEVLDAEGNVIGERVLHHPHVNEQPFTRSLTLSIDSAIKQITIRAKDSEHGYGGATITIDVPDTK